MRPFSDIIADQIIPKALSPGFFLFFSFLMGDEVEVVVVSVEDLADVGVRVGGGRKRVYVCICLNACVQDKEGAVCGLTNTTRYRREGMQTMDL